MRSWVIFYDEEGVMYLCLEIIRAETDLLNQRAVVCDNDVSNRPNSFTLGRLTRAELC
jgi:hypothetical protein